VGTDSPAPVTEAPLVVDDTRTVAPVDASVDSQGASAAESGTLAEVSVAAENTVAAEASAEQP
jgi:hypothetical protein